MSLVCTKQPGGQLGRYCAISTSRLETKKTKWKIEVELELFSTDFQFPISTVVFILVVLVSLHIVAATKSPLINFSVLWLVEIMMLLIFLSLFLTNVNCETETCTSPLDDNCEVCCQDLKGEQQDEGCIISKWSCADSMDQPWCQDVKPWYNEQLRTKEACEVDCKPCAICLTRTEDDFKHKFTSKLKLSSDCQNLSTDCPNILQDPSLIDPCYNPRGCGCLCERYLPPS